ncbi:putative uncharacterized protein [Proteobacteria bacterium CAG:495]|nr:putative uncharacterized protein [Proteobacteria bacterium CAG:495]
MWDFIFWFFSNIIEIIIACVAIGLLWFAYREFCKWRLHSRIGKLEDFTVSHKLVGDDGKTALALDDKAKRICYFTKGLEQPVSHIVPYKDLLAVELSRTGEAVTTTSATSQLSRGVVGGLALGGIGALAGGLSGKQKHHNFTKRISILLTFNDVYNPHLAIAISDGYAKTGSLVDSVNTGKANEWLSCLQVIVKNNEKT